MKWEEKRLDQLGELGRGKSRHRPRNDVRLYGGEFPFVQTSEIQNANFRITEFKATYSSFGLAQSKLWPSGTLCISIVGANTAATAILGFDACFPDSVIGFNGYQGVANNYFIKYLIDTRREEFYRISQGTARENLSMEKLLSMPLTVPPFIIQQKIASILSAYDDLIENNLKRIRLLEEAAQNLYREWFVQFRFPGYEAVEFVDGLPKGWERRSLDSICNFIGGFAFKSSEYNATGKYKVVTIKNVGDRLFNNQQFDCLEEIPGKLKESQRISEGDILLSLTGNVGRTCLAFGENLMLNQRVAIIKPKEIDFQAFIYCYFGSLDAIRMMQNLSSGVAQQNLSPVKLGEQSVLVPEASILKEFSRITYPLIQSLLNCFKTIEKLKEARDILLPRLMNQTIEI